MAQVIRPVGFSSSYQELVVDATITGTVSAHTWGGGGGGGGGPDGRGSSGYGGGGGFALVNFTVAEGDVIGIAVGGAGRAGSVGSGVPGGAGGGSLVTGLDWSSLNLLTQTGVVRYQNSAYTGFLNDYGVWNTDIGSASFVKSESVYFPSTATYTVIGSADNYGTIEIDGVGVLSMPGFSEAYSTTITITQGYHTIRVTGYNTGGPGCIGARIYNLDPNSNFGGARGGYSGGSGGSGSGGGSGGATVVTLNGSVISVAGGGGGGGGAGQYSYVPSLCDAPGANEHSIYYSGQNGQSFSGDGGGGGAGGGGYGGGQGGATRGNETTGGGGAYGLSYSINGSTYDPSGTAPGAAGSSYRTAAVGVGGRNGITGSGPLAGGPGYAVFEFNQHVMSVKDNGAWSVVNGIYVKDNGAWKTVNAAYIKQAGSWIPVYGTNKNVPNFTTVIGKYGSDPRSY